MKHVSRLGVVLSATLLIVATGCASKGWVRQEMSKQDAQVDQRIVQMDERIGSETQRVDKRVDSVEGRVSQEAQKTDGMGVRVGTLESSVTSASEAARGARDRADAAMAKAEGVDGRLTKLSNNRYNTKVVDTVNVQFGFNRSELDDGAQTTLLGLVKEMQANPGLTVELVGYTDMKGARDYNYTLSQRRVDSVRRFLVEKGVQIARIQAVGLGALADPGTPEAQKRRVGGQVDDRPELGKISRGFRPTAPVRAIPRPASESLSEAGLGICRSRESGATGAEVAEVDPAGVAEAPSRLRREEAGSARRRRRGRRGRSHGPGPTRRPLRGRGNLVALGVHTLGIGNVIALLH